MARTRVLQGGRGLDGPVRAVLALALALTLAGCETPPRMPQQTGVVVSARFDGPPGTGVVRTQLPNGGRAWGWPRWPGLPSGPPGPDSNIDARLLADIQAGPGGRLEEILVEYRDIVTPPVISFGCRPAGLRPATPPGGPRSFADSLRGMQADWYARERKRLATDFGAVVLDSFGITRALVVRARLDAIRRLAARPIVEWIGYAHRGAGPPEACAEREASGTVDAFVSDGRAVLGSDPLRDAGYATGRLSLLDTGVRTSHKLLQEAIDNSSATTRPGLVSVECLTHASCSDAEHADVDVADGGHGTKTCGILVGSAQMGACFEGATRALVESYRVYRDDGARGALDPTAFKRACEQVLGDPAPVAIMEVADPQGPGGTLGLDVAQLYERGVAVLAAAGNWSSGLGSPGSHPYVLSVGTRDLKIDRASGERKVVVGGTSENQCRGTIRNRRKPDLQAPSLTLSAGSLGDTELGIHSGSSGAVPYAGVAALILRNWMAATATTNDPAQEPDPGQVYAALLACCDGQRAGRASQSTTAGAEPREFALDQGAGLVHLPDSGRGWWGKVEVGTSAHVDIPLRFEPGTEAVRKVRVAIWWPDPKPRSSAEHRDADLELLDSEGAPLASSRGSEGVFERLDYTVAGDVLPAGFIVRIVGTSIDGLSRPVYFTAIATP